MQISDGRYRHFVIIEFPVTVAYKAFLEDIKNNPATKNNIKKIKDTEAFKELERLVTVALFNSFFFAFSNSFLVIIPSS